MGKIREILPVLVPWIFAWCERSSAAARPTAPGAVFSAEHAVDPNSGYQITITLADLAEVPASQFLKFALLLR